MNLNLRSSYLIFFISSNEDSKNENENTEKENKAENKNTLIHSEIT